jgi:predicted Mrr-cat superfamily restriction endonuclease
MKSEKELKQEAIEDLLNRFKELDNLVAEYNKYMGHCDADDRAKKKIQIQEMEKQIKQ